MSDMVLLYEVTYIDDWEEKHIAYAFDTEDVNFLKERFQILQINKSHRKKSSLNYNFDN